LHDEILTKIILLRITHPIRLRLPALILGILIKEAAIQAAVQVIAAMGAYILPPNGIMALDGLSAGIAENHDSLYTQRRNKLIVRSEESKRCPKGIFQPPDLRTLYLNDSRRPPGCPGRTVFQDDSQRGRLGADFIRPGPISGLAGRLPMGDEVLDFFLL